MRLHSDPGGRISAVEGRQGRLPLVWALVALLMVNSVVNSPELRADKVVGESLALRRGPVEGSGLLEDITNQCQYSIEASIVLVSIFCPCVSAKTDLQSKRF